jgi:large subunit ribosomal protein L10
VLRSDKVKVVEGLAEDFGRQPHLFLATFSGLNVNQATDLRRKVREVGGSFRVIKNRLAKRAAGGTGVEKIADRLTGPCALAGHETDPVQLAKVLTDFSKGNPQLEILAGVVDAQQVVDGDGVKRLASLPGLPELRAQLLSLILTPATSLVRLLNTPGGRVARALGARREKLEEAG